MSIKNLMKTRRTIRKFTSEEISEELLISYIDCARLAPSGANLQPLKYAVINKEESVASILEYVKWAAYLKGMHEPNKDEVPTAFIAVFKDKNIASSMAEFDAGAAAMSINLAAEEDGIGCCIMGAIDRPNICRLLNTDDNLELMYLIALGYKKEQPASTDLENGDVKYFLKDGQLIVPKRRLKDVIVKVN